MRERTTAVDAYLRYGMFSVAGYLDLLDARIMRLLLAFQGEKGILGNLCEIGVHHGRLFLILALCRRANERALAIDLFEDDKFNFPSRHHRGRDRALITNALRLGISLSEDEILKTSSLDIQEKDILARTVGPMRFFSIDGNHGYRYFENDLRLATRTISNEGIIVVDDFFNVNFPDVTFAAYNFLKNTDEVVPFLVTPSKLYLTRPSMAIAYQAQVRKANLIRDAKCSSVHLFGRNAFLMRRDLRYRLLALADNNDALRWGVRLGSRLLNNFPQIN